jgi:ABC-type lipoprotein release transport system permease subunit
MALAARNLGRQRRGAAFSAFGVAVGVGCLVFFGALGAGVSELVRTKLFPVDAASLEVVAPPVSLGSMLGGPKLDEALRARLAALPGVRAVRAKMAVRVGAVSRYDGDFFGRPLRMGLELVAVGVDPALVAEDVAAGRSFADRGAESAVPVVLNTRLLEIYNKSFAVQRGLPHLTPDLLAGFEFPAEFGRSFVAGAGAGTVQPVRLEVVGFSDRALLGGVTMPLEAARRMNRAQNKDFESFSAFVVQTDDPGRVPALAESVRRMGLELDDAEQRMAEQAGFGVLAVTAALTLLSVLISALAAVNIAHAFWAAVRERRREIGVLRAVGASRSDVMRVLLSEAALIGVAGGITGVAAGAGAAFAGDLVASRWLPDFPFKPESFFVLGPGLVLAGLAVALVSAAAGAYGPARSAARLEPAAALAE